MASISLRFDMRGPEFGAPRPQLYAAALEMAEYADRNGIHAVTISEHHGVDDGYLPSPIVLASAIAARTKHMRLSLAAIIAGLHDPLRLAEDLAVLDQISNGRLTVVFAGGYVPDEYAMFGKDIKQRVSLLEEAIQTIKQASTREPIEYRGRTVRITPRPVQRPHPHLMLGGSVPAAAKRAARLTDGLVTHIPELYQVYYDEAKALGKNPLPFRKPSPGFVYIAEDPEAAWRDIAPHALHEMNAYGKWSAAAGTDSMYTPVTTVAELKASGGYAVITPDECVKMVRELGNLLLHPLMGGMPPELGWRSLELFVNKVQPALAD
jgi:alkanesulfonate monooxygenase SsuD/methylene tetrahydromethanopterin reductase-like flavin-dependent oxidoreductase (luciferase family)